MFSKILGVSTAIALLAAISVGAYPNIPVTELPGTVNDETACQNQRAVEEKNVRLVTDSYQEIFGDQKIDAVDKYFRPDYIQHNPRNPDGPEALKGFVKYWLGDREKEKIDFDRISGDGDLVWGLVTVTTPEGSSLAKMDIFRIQDGQIAEHWDTIQPTAELIPKVASPQPHPRAENRSELTCLEQKAVELNNKQEIESVYQEIFANRDTSAADKYFHQGYVQNNPVFGDGSVNEIKQFATQWSYLNPDGKVEIKRIAAKGNLVWVHLKAEFPDGKEMAIINAFKLEAGKIVEHWDVFETISDLKESKNPHPYF